MKNFFLIFLLLNTVIISAKLFTESGNKASKKNWQLEFMNKRSMPVKVKVININPSKFSFNEEVTAILGGKGETNSWLRVSGLNDSNPVVISVYPSIKNRTMKERGKLEAYEKDEFTTKGYGFYFNKLMSPVNLTIDYDVVRPQTGTFKGLSGKTESGLDNSKNIKVKELEYAINAFNSKYKS